VAATKHVPDIIEVISDLSNDEVRTPPKVANQVLDLLPKEVWNNAEYRWLDPGSKSGVFLREATKRLMVGLADRIPDEQDRLRHILKNQMFGVCITELSSMMSRRALYCSKDASGEQSIVTMDSPMGNLWHDRVSHPFKNERCTECGAGQDKFGSLRGENHAYAFIHENGRKAVEEVIEMKFDVIVGNPSYQIDADAAGQNVNPIYDRFVEQSIAMAPRFISMIIPARWMAGGKGLDGFRERILSSKNFSQLVDYPNPKEIFPQVEIKGGVAYFLWDSQHQGPCSFTSVRQGISRGPQARNLSEFDVFIRDDRALPILRKVMRSNTSSRWLSAVITTRDPFGPALSSNLRDHRSDKSRRTGDLKCYMVSFGKRVAVWIDPAKVSRNEHLIDCWKVFLPKAGSDGGQKIPDIVIGAPLIGEPGSVSTMTFLAAGPLASNSAAESFESYMKSRFVRFLISLRKISQNTTSGVYGWVPLQDWDRTWTDAELYKMYAITPEEQEYIAEMVKEMPAK